MEVEPFLFFTMNGALFSGGGCRGWKGLRVEADFPADLEARKTGRSRWKIHLCQMGCNSSELTEEGNLPIGRVLPHCQVVKLECSFVGCAMSVSPDPCHFSAGSLPGSTYAQTCQVPTQRCTLRAVKGWTLEPFCAAPQAVAFL